VKLYRTRYTAEVEALAILEVAVTLPPGRLR